MFESTYRSAHEPEMDATLDAILDAQSGEGSTVDLQAFVTAQDRKLWLEMNSSQLNFFLLPALLECFPEAKFILTIRNPYDWLDSFINHQLSRPLEEEFDRDTARRWRKYRQMRFQREMDQHHPEDKKLLEKGLFTLDGYLSYWARHNHRALSVIPPLRLLVVRTQDISQSPEKIAEFLGIPSSSLDTGHMHANRARERHGVLEELDPKHLDTVVDRHCQPLMNQFFPESQSAQDAFA
jgi:hypothetical protein